MKKIILSVAAISMLAAVSCSSSSTCCEYSILGQTLKYCKKNDTTLTVTAGGQTTDFTKSMMGGVTADKYLETLKAAGCK